MIERIDEEVLLWINDLVGESSILDRMMILFANDYFIPVIIGLILLGLWFWGGNVAQRENLQQGVIVAAISIGSACGFVLALNHLYFHPHPFEAIPSLAGTVDRIYYPIVDPSFPSNTSAITFAAATSIWQRNRKIGWFLFIPAILMPFAKIYAAVYWPSDILAGAAVGILTSYFIYKIMMPVFKPFINLFYTIARKICLA